MHDEQMRETPQPWRSTMTDIANTLARATKSMRYEAEAMDMNFDFNGSEALEAQAYLLPDIAAHIADLEAKAAAAEKHVEALREKHTDKCCACAYDNPDDVCGLHAVMAERDAARGEVALLRQAIVDMQAPKPPF